MGLNVDSAPKARLRYYYRVTEGLEFTMHDPGNRPQAVQGLGDGDAFGPAGAYWVDDFRQLFVLRGERLFIYQVTAPGLGAAGARRAALRLARATLPGKARQGPHDVRDDADARPALVLLAPRAGELVRSGRVVVRGTVTGADASVRVAGARAPVVQGTFAGFAALKRGPNRIRVDATAGGRTFVRTVMVRRGASARAVGVSLRRRRPGVVPDLLGEPLADARALLGAAGLRYRLVWLAEGPRSDRGWAVCVTRPAEGERLRGGRRLLLLVDRADPFRASGTACAQA